MVVLYCLNFYLYIYIYACSDVNLSFSRDATRVRIQQRKMLQEKLQTLQVASTGIRTASLAPNQAEETAGARTCTIIKCALVAAGTERT